MSWARALQQPGAYAYNYIKKNRKLQMAIKVNCRVKENYSNEEKKICHHPNITNSIYFIVMLTLFLVNYVCIIKFVLE